MARPEMDQRWWPLMEQLIGEMKQWRLDHPTASFTAIETALDGSLAALRACMLADLSLASAAADFGEARPEDRPRCPACDRPLQSRGMHPRELQTWGGEPLVLSRTYGHCPACDAGLFPPR